MAVCRQFLINEVFEGPSKNLGLRKNIRAPEQKVHKPDVEEVELGSLDHASLGAFSKGFDEATQQGILKNLKVTSHRRGADAAFAGDILIVDHLSVAEGSRLQETVEGGHISDQGLR